LLDPTIQEGHPLWYGYRNWEVTPSIGADISLVHPPRDSLFNDFIYWAQKPEAFINPSSTNPVLNSHKPIQALLHLICAEWLTIAEYVKTRLGQIEWEISFPEHFLNKGSEIDVALKKLHIWRRLVPLYREMLSETLQRVFHFPCHTSGIGSMTISGAGDSNSTGTEHPTPCQCALHQAVQHLKQGPINAFRDDFTRALSYMEEYQQRIDRLTSVVTAIISIDDSRRSQDDNRNVARLTWLATFFIPLGFIASLFSMQQDVGQLTETYKTYFAVALPLAAVSLGLAFTLALPSVRRLGRRTKNALTKSR
jgi:Mg2+ and Co2+ transporter CorA